MPCVPTVGKIIRCSGTKLSIALVRMLTSKNIAKRLAIASDFRREEESQGFLGGRDTFGQ